MSDKKKQRMRKKPVGLKLDMGFDEAMRRVSKIKPEKKPAKRKN